MGGQSIIGVFLLALVSVSFAATYCTNTGPLKAEDSTLGDVTLVGESGQTISSQKFCGTGLNDLTKTQKTTVKAGKSYSITWSGDTCGSIFGKVGKVFIDWKQKGFNSGDSGADVALEEPDARGATWTVTTDFTVPSDAVSGETRMRIMVIEGSDPSAVMPCASFPFGGTTDYTIIVTGGSGSGGMSGGTLFLILLIVALWLYITIGYYYNYKKKGLRKLEACPNLTFWTALPGLVKDGCKFTHQKIQSCRKKDYSTLPDV